MKSFFATYLKLSHKHRIWSLLVFSLFIALLITIGSFKTSSPQEKWVNVILENKNATIAFPVAPDHSVGTLKFDGVATTFQEGIFVADSESIRYVLSVINISDERLKNDPSAVFNSQLRHIVGMSSNNTLVSRSKSDRWKVPAHDFVIQNIDTGNFTSGSLIYQGETLYTLLISYPNGSSPDKDIERFRNSFVFGK